MKAAEFIDTECPQCGSDAVNGAICRDCDIAFALGVCWQCQRQVERFVYNPTLFELAGTEVPDPVEAQGHAADCMVGRNENAERDRIVAWLIDQTKGDARFLRESDLTLKSAAEAIHGGAHRK